MEPTTSEVTKVIVGLGTCGIAAGAGKIQTVIKEAIEAAGVDVEMGITSCMGNCHAEPLIEVIDAAGKSTFYGNLTAGKAANIVKKHVVGGEPVAKWAFDPTDPEDDEGAFYLKQEQIVLRNCGKIDPENIEDYLARDGYKALKKAIEMGPEATIEEVKASGLRGRGGAGFPTGLKWTFARGSQADRKYVICNADEGDPGAFMDRSTIEGDPHAVLEGMAICGWAIGAHHAYIYCRAEYPLAVKRLKMGIEQAMERNLLGDDIMGTGFDFHIKVKEGAGAFVCGEETALMASIEGERGMPRIRPPFPAQKGLWGYPSNINNVETFANVAWIILHGGAAFAAKGTEKSKGSKVFALAGRVKRGGLVEVPMGLTLREVIYDVGGGSDSGREIKAVQMGGPSGGCVPASLFDTRIDYEEVTKTGAIMGSGGCVVMDETSCMVDIARFFLDFTQKESCGKCTFCRVGTKRMLEILERITVGQAEESDLDLLEELADRIKRTSLCGLGQTAPNPVLTTLRYFREEYLAHIRDHKCPAGRCRELTTFEITDDCTGCKACIKPCPTLAITGEKKQVHVIDQDKCISCGVCRDVCRFNAVAVV